MHCSTTQNKDTIDFLWLIEGKRTDDPLDGRWSSPTFAAWIFATPGELTMRCHPYRAVYSRFEEPYVIALRKHNKVKTKKAKTQT